MDPIAIAKRQATWTDTELTIPVIAWRGGREFTVAWEDFLGFRIVDRRVVVCHRTPEGVELTRTPLSFQRRAEIEAEANGRLERAYVAGRPVHGSYVPRMRTTGRAARVERLWNVFFAVGCVGLVVYLASRLLLAPQPPFAYWPGLAALGLIASFLLGVAALATGQLRRENTERQRAARWHRWTLEGRTLHVASSDGSERTLTMDQVGFDEFVDESTRERVSLCTLAPGTSRRALLLGQMALMNRTAVPRPSDRRITMRLLLLWPAVAVLMFALIPPFGSLWFGGLLPAGYSILLGAVRLYRGRGFDRELPELTARGLELIKEARRAQRR